MKCKGVIAIPPSCSRRVEHHPLSAVYGAVFESVCSKECGIGQYRHYQVQYSTVQYHVQYS